MAFDCLFNHLCAFYPSIPVPYPDTESNPTVLCIVLGADVSVNTI
jgi:hypothetical protein